MTKPHVAVLPFPFSSHPNTLMTLVLKIATSAPQIQFSFFGTKKSNHSLLSFSPNLNHLPSNINIYDVDDGVPLDHKFSNSPYEPFDLFLNVALENLTKAIQTVAAETRINITCILTDAFLTFSGEIAERLNASWVPVWTGLPSNLYGYLHSQLITTTLANEKMGADQNLEFIPALSMMRVKDLPTALLTEDSEKSLFAKLLCRVGEVLPKAEAVAVSSFEELNPVLLNSDLKSKFKNFLNLGIVAESSVSDPAGCLSWLEGQASKSVAYISFGTLAELPEKELQALAEALECCEIPFLWSLKDKLREKLPSGFVERTSQRGKIVSWAPQPLLLAHDSVGVFISHAGYSAVRECIVNGVCMICRPFWGDQMMAARLVEVEWRIGTTVEDGVITKNGLLKNLKPFLIADDEQGKKMRENVQRLKNVVSMAAKPGGSATRDFNKLMEIISMV